MVGDCVRFITKLNFIHIDKTHVEHCKCYLRHDPQMITILFAVLFVLIIRFGRRYRATLTRAYFNIAFDSFINHHRCSCGFSSCTYLIHDVWTYSVELSMHSHTFIPTVSRASTDTACHIFLIAYIQMRDAEPLLTTLMIRFPCSRIIFTIVLICHNESTSIRMSCGFKFPSFYAVHALINRTRIFTKSKWQFLKWG